MKKIDIAQTILIIILIIFGLFIAYQLIRKILGGSWGSEDIILGLLIFNIGLCFTIALNNVKNSFEIKHLSSHFRILAKDFKEHNHYS